MFSVLKCPPRLAALATLVMLAAPTLALPSLAWAATPQGEDERFYGVFVLLALVASAYLISYLLLGWLTRRYGFVLGVQYIVLGILAGPVFGLLGPELLQSFEPALALAVGAIGLLAGLEFNLRRLFAQEARAWKLAVLVSLVTLALVAGVPVLLGRELLADGALANLTGGAAGLVPALLAIGAVALVADSRQLVALVRFFDARGSIARLAANVCWLCSVLAIATFTALFSFSNPGPAFVTPSLVPLQWLVAHLAVGGILGAICGALVQQRPDDERLLTILIGTVVLASGIAYTTTLSIVAVNFIAGVVIVNMSGESLRVQRMFAALERPLYILLLFFAGTALAAGVPPWVYLLVAPYLGLRFLGRWLGVTLYRPSVSGLRPTPGLHRALWAPGSLTAAMILDYNGVFTDHPYTAYVVSGLIAALFASEIISYLLTRSWLIDITDLDVGPRGLSTARAPMPSPEATPTRGGR